jgi:hypothetical protein
MHAEDRDYCPEPEARTSGDRLCQGLLVRSVIDHGRPAIYFSWTRTKLLSQIQAARVRAAGILDDL